MTDLGARGSHFFGNDSEDCLNIETGVQYISDRSGCKLVTLFGSDCGDGLKAVIGVQHTEVPNLGASWSHFLAVTVMNASTL